MSFKTPMRLNMKLGLITALLLLATAVCLVVTVNLYMRKEARVMAEREARIILSTRHASNLFFNNDLRPPLFSMIKAHGVRQSYFNPTWMSATHANRITFDYFKEMGYEEFSYKNAAIDARSPVNEANAYERAFLEKANASADVGEWSGVLTLEKRPYFVLMIPNGTRFTEMCMRCHREPEEAPADLVAMYGDKRSFHKKIGDIPAVYSLRIPLAKAYANVNRLTLTMSLGLLPLLTTAFILHWRACHNAIVRPVGRLCAAVNAISEDDSHLGKEISLSTSREIADLSAAFSQMSLRLRRNRDSLEGQVWKRTAALERANRQLTLQERQFRRLLESTHAVPFEIDMDSGKITYLGPQIDQVLGIRGKELGSLADLLAVIDGEDRKALLSHLRDPAVHDPEKELHFRASSADGKRRWITATVELLPAQTKEKGPKLVGFMRDVTLRKEAEAAVQRSEERFRHLYEKSPMSYQSLDENGNFLTVNETWLTVLGYERAEVLGRNFSEFLHPDWQAHFRENFPRFKAVGEVLGVEFEMVQKSGERILVSFHGKVGHAPDGSFKQTHCVFRDITREQQAALERERLEDELRQTRKLEAIGTLAGGIAHDFNNILGIVIGNAELALDDVPEWNPARQNLDEIKTAGLRAREVVRQLLNFSRKAKRQKKPVRLSPMVLETVKLLRSSLPSFIDFEVSAPEDLPPIDADPTQLHQILINLCTNAAHAMEDGGGTLCLTVSKAELSDAQAKDFPNLSAGTFARLTVSDTGPGIDPSVREKIFDPYFTTKEVGKGTGMGLAVVHGIVANHGGAITAGDRPGGGTLFTVLFPSIDAAVAMDTGDNAPLPRGRETVLVVDDEPAILRMSGKVLQRLGYRVATESDPAAALAKFTATPDRFDLVITDMTMPKMTGDRLTEALLNLRPDLPVILCTGYSQRIGPERAGEIGIRRYIEKPFDKRILAMAVREVLDGKAADSPPKH